MRYATTWSVCVSSVRTCVVVMAVLALSAGASAEGTRQLGTGGVAQIEGAAGGGLVPWAAITGYGTREERGVNAFASGLETDDLGLRVFGVAAGFNNRVEFSLARQELSIDAPGLPDVRQDIIGVKVRLAGDVIYSRMPQIAIGAQYKRNLDFDLPRALGADKRSGVDFYVTATKVFLAGVADYNTFVTGTARLTEANETGLLGFSDGYHLQGEVSVGALFSRRLAAGIEYRTKSGDIGFNESDWRSVFLAWFPNRNLSLVLAYVDLGDVAVFRNQSGVYLSVVGGF